MTLAPGLLRYRISLQDVSGVNQGQVFRENWEKSPDKSINVTVFCIAFTGETATW